MSNLLMERLVDVNEMARILGVPTTWLYQRTRLGPSAIPFVKMGKYVRFDPREVLSFFQEGGADGNNAKDDVS